MTGTTISYLLDQIQELTCGAIHSAGISTQLEQVWRSLEEKLKYSTPSPEDQCFIQDLSTSHRLLATCMISCEEMLVKVCEDAQMEMGQNLDHDPVLPRDLKRRTDDLYSNTQPISAVTCPMRRWFYENLLHPFPSISVRREIQRINGMSMSNINGWFSNMRRRSGWNTHLQELAGGDRVAYKQIIQACFNGSQENKAIKRKIEDVIDYAIGRARGEVGEWLTDVVDGDKMRSQNRMPSTDEIVSPPNHEKRRKIISHRVHSIFRHKIDNTPVDIDEEFFELGSDKLGVSNEMPAMSYGWSTHPQRSFSSSSCGSTISDVSAAVPEEPIFRPFHPPSYHHQSMVDGQQYGLPVSFGGPPQQFSFEPVLNRQDVIRKRTQSQTENFDASGRTAKVARFS